MRTLLRALGMPFQLTSLLFVAFTALALAIVRGVGGVGGAISPMSVMATYILLSWLNKYAFALLDQAAHGGREAPVASVEMLGPFGDSRAWVHPLLGTALWLLLAFAPLPVPPLLLLGVVLLLWPASLAALATSHRILDAVNPVALWQMLRGMGAWYLLLLAALAAAAALMLWLQQWPVSGFTRYGLQALLLLCLYACVGGAIHERRVLLNFEPLNSPEREAERDEDERLAERQRMLDAAFTATRSREPQRATQLVSQWLAAADSRRVHGDAEAILAQAARWPEARAFGLIARAVMTQCLAARQLPLALMACEAALTRLPQFAPDSADQTRQLAELARHSGRPRLAEKLLQNDTDATAPPDDPST